MHRFYLSPSQWSQEKPELDPADSHHCADVLRLKPGDRVTVFDGEGKVAGAELAEVHRKHCVLRLEPARSTPEPRCSITLVQAVPKGKTMDLILQKAVELGAAAIVPLTSERTVVRVEKEDSPRKQERWQQIALEACKQCGRNKVPKVSHPTTVKGYLCKPGVDLLLLASLQPDARPLREILSRFAESKGRPPESVAILVGPEGDFTPGEIALAKGAGALAVTLGPMILRAETAAFYCLSVLGHELF